MKTLSLLKVRFLILLAVVICAAQINFASTVATTVPNTGQSAKQRGSPASEQKVDVNVNSQIDNFGTLGIVGTARTQIAAPIVSSANFTYGISIIASRVTSGLNARSANTMLKSNAPLIDYGESRLALLAQSHRLAAVTVTAMSMITPAQENGRAQSLSPT